MAGQKSVFNDILTALRKGRRGSEMPTPKQVLTGQPGVTQPQSSLENKQQAFLDIQYQKIAHDLYSRSVYYDTDRIGAYNDYRAMDMSPEISAALDIIADECLEANTVIPLLNGEKVTIEELFKRKEKDFWVYSYNLENNKTEPTVCKKVVYKGEQEVYKVIFDDDSYIMATKEHKWLLKNKKQYLTTKELKENISIQPFYTRISSEEDRINHKIKKIEYVGKRKTYDLVDVGEHHNFAVLTSNGTGVFTHNCVTRGDKGEILSVYSSNARVKKVLQDLFFNVLNVDYNLAYWIRELVKFGDNFLLLEVDKNQGIFDVRDLPVAEIHREEAYDGNMNSARFRWDTNNMYFEEWQVAHFRLISDGSKLPYGRSILDPCRKLWKQLQLAEDAMLIYRILRAPDRRVHYIETGNIDPADIPAYIERVKRDLKKQPIVDAKSGQMNLKYNPAPVWKKTPIPLLDGRTITIEELAKEYEEGKENYVYAVQDKTHKVVPGKVAWCGKNYTAKKLTKVWLDDNTWVLTAPEHPFVLRNGTEIRADKLKEGDSLMPYYEDKEKLWNVKEPYKTIYNPENGKYEFVHRLVANEVEGKCDYKKTIHHKNFIKEDNTPKNLEWVNSREHVLMHKELIKRLWENEDFRKMKSEEMRQLSNKIWAKDDGTKKREHAERLIKYNKSEAKLKRVSELNKERNSIKAMQWYNNSELHKEHNEIRSESLQGRWDNKEEREKLSKSMTIQTNERMFDIMVEKIKEHSNFINVDNFASSLVESEAYEELKKINPKTNRNLKKFFIKKNVRRILRENGIDNYTEFLSKYNSELLEKKSQKYRSIRIDWGEENLTRNKKGQYEYKNHKVTKVESVVVEGEDVYCMTVMGLNDEHDRHNFALYSFEGDFENPKCSESGVYVKNTVEEDYFIPIKGDKGSRIENLAGACLALDTKIDLLDGRSLELSEIIKEYEEGKKLWSYSINPDTGEIVPGAISWAGVTRKNTDVVKITLDNGETITTTPDHKFPTRFNGEKEAKNLVEGESLWSFNKKFEKIKGAGKKRKRNTYEMIYNHEENKWLYTHRVVANYFKNLNLQEDFLYLKETKEEFKNTIHHKNFDRYNNNPDNLCFMNSRDHFYYHQDNMKRLEEFFGLEKIEEWKDSRREGIKGYWKNISEEDLEKKREVSRKNFLKGTQKLQELLKDEEYKKAFYEKTSKSLKISQNRPEFKEIQSETTTTQWETTNLREIIKEKQGYKYSDELLKFIIELYKEGNIDSNSILNEVNNDNSWFIREFRDLNEGNKQMKKMSNFTHNNLCKMLKEFGYDNFRDFKEKVECYNHKIVSVEFLEEKMDTGTITIDGDEKYHNFHNFALSCGVFTKNSNLGDIQDVEYLQNKLFAALKVPKTYLNYTEALPGGSTLSQADLRFSRTINRIQEGVLMELRRMANIHLHFLGFDDDLDNFTLSLTNPSTQQELLKLETMKVRLEVFKEMFTSDAHSPVSYTWAMENIMGFSKSDIKQILRQKKIEKKMFAEVDGAVEEYLETGMFAELDNKFRKPDFEPGAGEEVKDDGMGDEGGGGFGNFGGGLGDFGAGESIAGGEDLAGGPEALDVGTEEMGEEPLAEKTKSNKVFNLLFENEEKNNTLLLEKNKKMNAKTKRLLKNLDKKFKKDEDKEE